jgi:murein DD-endopeptidase MepM/ murein hydrolase activator NlpD
VGTPLRSPRSGRVLFDGNQPGGAGLYLVVHGSDDRDYVFMHLRPGSIRVDRGERVAAGERIAEVGTTGASTGPHLHFEIWVGGWYSGGHPIDPLPDLRRWAGG